MGKFIDLQTELFNIIEANKSAFGTVKVYPANFVSVNPGNNFLRVTVIPTGPGINLRSVSGLVTVDIYVPVGEGPKSTSLIADQMDTYLVGKSFNTLGNNGTLQFSNSSLAPGTIDRDSPGLYRSTYSIPFNFFGV
jgi:hypothetical protein